MLWLAPAAFTLTATGPATGSDPGSIVSSAVTTVLGFGILGVVVMVLCVLFYLRWRLISPAQEDAIREAARTAGRADLLEQAKQQHDEIERLRAECKTLAEQRDEALTFVRQQLMPMLVDFTATTRTLLPILQQAIAVAGQGLWPQRHRDEIPHQPGGPD